MSIYAGADMSIRTFWQHWRRRHRPLRGGGVSTPFGGFTLPLRGASERDRVLDLLDQMEEKKVLYAHYDAEYEGYVNDAVLLVRGFLTGALRQLGRRAAARPLVRNMRDACNRYLVAAPDPVYEPFTQLRPEFRQALKELRESFRISLLALAAEYRLPEAKAFAQRIELSGT